METSASVDKKPAINNNAQVTVETLDIEILPVIYDIIRGFVYLRFPFICAYSQYFSNYNLNLLSSPESKKIPPTTQQNKENHRIAAKR